MAKKKTVKKTTKVRSLPARKGRDVKAGSVFSNTVRMLSDMKKEIIGNIR